MGPIPVTQIRTPAAWRHWGYRLRAQNAPLAQKGFFRPPLAAILVADQALGPKGGDGVKIRIETVPGLDEDEVVIRCASVDEKVQQLQKRLLEQAAEGQIVFYKENQEFYFPLSDILFFETEGEAVYAHTTADAYRTKYRLYELEEMLPRAFVRAAKSTIVNTGRVYSVARDLTASSLVQFAGTHKQVYASRRYWRALRERLAERKG